MAQTVKSRRRVADRACEPATPCESSDLGRLSGQCRPGVHGFHLPVSLTANCRVLLNGSFVNVPELQNICSFRACPFGRTCEVRRFA